jgi:hypothetical protein
LEDVFALFIEVVLQRHEGCLLPLADSSSVSIDHVVPLHGSGLPTRSGRSTIVIQPVVRRRQDGPRSTVDPPAGERRLDHYAR